MELPWFGKIKHPLPVFFALLTTGIIGVGASTYLILGTDPSESNLDELTIAVTEQDLSVRIQSSGTIVPIQRVSISPKTSGRLVQLLVNQGDRVEKGQKLAVMENTELQAQYIQGQASLSQAQARLAEAKAGTRPEEIAQAKARLIQAQARLDEAKVRIPKQIDQAKATLAAAQSRLGLASSRVERYRYLVDEGAVSQDRFDEALNEFQNAQANLFDAQQRLAEAENTTSPEIIQQQAAVAEVQKALEQLQNGSRPEQIAQLQAAVDEAKARLLDVEIKLKDSILTAPFSGIVTQKNAEAGDFVSPTLGASNTSILEIANGLKVEVRVPEVDIIYIQPGQPVQIFADAYPDQVFQGIVQLVAPEAIIEQNVTTFEVQIALQTGQDKLLSGMNVDITFLGQEMA
ncbi:MAG: HlyD family secretion protein, partial [Cyanobacteriota bacterium]